MASLKHPWVSLAIAVFTMGFPWFAHWRRTSGPLLRRWVVEAALPLALAALVLDVYWPLAQGHAPTNGDHGFHLLKLRETLDLLRTGRLFGWTDLEFAGLPQNVNYPAGGSLLGALIAALPGVDLTRAYAWSLLLHELVVVGAMYTAARLHFGAGTGLVAGFLALCDRGDWWVGGYFSSYEIGMWIQALATALVLLGLAVWPLAAERGRGRRGLLAGGFIGLGVIFHPQAAMLAAFAALPMVVAMVSAPGLRVRDVIQASAAVAVTAFSVSAWWTVPYVAQREFSNPPAAGPISSATLWEQLANAELLKIPSIWQGAAVLSLWLLARRCDAFSRFIALGVPLLAAITTTDFLKLIHPSNPGFADELQLQRDYFLIRELAILGIAYAFSGAVAAALRTSSAGKRLWRGLPERILAGLTIALVLSLPGAFIPGWPDDPTLRGLQGEDRKHFEEALDKAANLMGPGDRLALRHHDYFNHDLVWPTALRGLKMEVIGGDAAVMFRGRFHTDDVDLLERIGCTVLLSEGDLPDPLKQLPTAGEFGPYTLRTLPRMPRAWVLGKGSVQIESWTDEEIRLKVDGVAPGTQVALGLGQYDAWRSASGGVTRPYPFHEASLSQIGAWNGEIVLRYQPLASQWIGAGCTLAGLLTLALVPLLRRRQSPFSQRKSPGPPLHFVCSAGANRPGHRAGRPGRLLAASSGELQLVCAELGLPCVELVSADLRLPCVELGQQPQ